MSASDGRPKMARQGVDQRNEAEGDGEVGRGGRLGTWAFGSTAPVPIAQWSIMVESAVLSAGSNPSSGEESRGVNQWTTAEGDRGTENQPTGEGRR